MSITSIIRTRPILSANCSINKLRIALNTLLLLSLTSLITLNSAWSQHHIARVTGTAEIEFDGRKPSKKERREAFNKAKERALVSYVSSLGLSAINEFDKEFHTIVGGNLDKFITHSERLRSETDKESGVYKVYVKAAIDKNRVESAFYKLSSRHGVKRKDKSRISFIFLSREKSGTNSYRIPSYNADVEQNIQKVFIENRFTVKSGSQLEHLSGGAYKKRRLEETYAKTGRVNWETASKAAELTDSHFFSYGTFDFASVTKSPINGLYVASVSVNAQLMDLESRDLLAVDGDVTYKAEAETPEIAMREARKLAAIKVAERMVDQLTDQNTF